MDKFVFLFPDTHNIEEDLLVNYNYPQGWEKHFNDYSTLLNQCMDLRYRSKGFQINHILLNGESLSVSLDMDDVHRSDKVFHVDMSYSEMKRLCDAGLDYHVDSDQILSLLKPEKNSKLVVGGFHMWGCVDRFAGDAYRKGFDVLVDEDLTDLLLARSRNSGFRASNFPSFNPWEKGRYFYETYMSSRKDKPWMHQG